MAKRSHEEHNIQKAICVYLGMSLPKDAAFWAVPNGGNRPDIITKNGRKFSLEGARLKAEGVRPGVADLMILWGGRLICLEVKTAKGRQSEAQKAWEQHITTCGALYRVVRSVDEVKDFLDMVGCHKPKRLGNAPFNDIDEFLGAKRGSVPNKAAAE